MAINEESVKAIEQSYFDTNFCKPLYNSYCFSRIPATLSTFFSGKNSPLTLPANTAGQHSSAGFVVLFFLDGFGYRFFEEYLAETPFLQRFAKEGIVSKLTAQFPSTTAAHVTCLNTGLEVGQSGLYEWFFYEPSLGKMIAPLLCSFAGDKEPGTLEKAGIIPQTLYPSHTIYQDLAHQGVQSFVLQPVNIAHSPYSEAMFKGATYLPFHHFADALDNVRDLYENKPAGKKRYVYVYLGDIDAVGHRCGTSSPEYARTVKQTFNMLEERLFKQIQIKEGSQAICIVTADHGMTDINPKDTLYVNVEIPTFEQYIARNSLGELLIPAGSCRDFFLHILPDRIEEAKKILENWLGERALVVTTKELITKGFFGSLPPSEIFLKRVGNLVILPRDNHAVWWYEKHRFEQHFYGMHGGLSHEEMEIPFLFLPF